MVCFGISIQVLSWRQQCWWFHYWDVLTNFWRSNWRSIFDIVERLLKSQSPNIIFKGYIHVFVNFIKLILYLGCLSMHQPSTLSSQQKLSHSNSSIWSLSVLICCPNSLTQKQNPATHCFPTKFPFLQHWGFLERSDKYLLAIAHSQFIFSTVGFR